MPLLLALRFWESNQVPTGGARARIAAVVDAWHQPQWPLPVALRSVPQVLPVFASRGWVASVAEWYRPIAIPSQPSRRVAPPTVQPPGAQQWLTTVIGSWRNPEPIQLPRRSVPDALAPLEPFVPFTRGWVMTVIDAWRPPTPVALPARRTPPPNPLFRPRAWMATVIDWWRPAIPQPQSPPKTPINGDPAFVPRRPRIAIMEAWSQVGPQAMPRRVVPVQESIFDPRRWFGAVLEWWREIRPFKHPRPRQTEEPPIIVPPPPTPEPEVCFPPVAPPVTAFSREAAPNTGYSRGTVTGSFQRQALGGLGATRAAAPTATFVRMAPPVDVASGTGWGDDYGEDYGGTEVATGAESTVATTFERATVANPGYTRTTAAGSYQRQSALAALSSTRLGAPEASITRMDEPECVTVDTEPVPPVFTGVGYGDDYGFNYGGGA